jgi:hypothetical protein
MTFEILVRDENGAPIDAAIEIVSNAIILQSRGGTKGNGMDGSFPAASNAP